MRNRQSGMTLVELLISAGLLVALLGILSAVYLSTRQAYEVNRAVTTNAAQLRSAIEAIQYDIGMAGYCGNPDSCAVGASPLSIETSASDSVQIVESLTSRYEESRYVTGGPAVEEVEFDVEDGRLFRTAAGERVAIAAGVERIVLLGYRSADDISGLPRKGPPDLSDLRALDLRLELTQDGRTTTEDFTVVMANL